MHGDQTGTLSMLILTNTSDDSLSTEAALMVIGGDIGDQWNPGQINISTVYTERPFQVIRLASKRQKGLHSVCSSIIVSLPRSRNLISIFPLLSLKVVVLPHPLEHPVSRIQHRFFF